MKMHDMGEKPTTPPEMVKKYYPSIEFDERQIKGIKKLPLDKKIKLLIEGRVKRIGRNYDNKLTATIEIRKAGMNNKTIESQAAREMLRNK